jgi:hypothetical protein
MQQLVYLYVPPCNYFNFCYSRSFIVTNTFIFSEQPISMSKANQVWKSMLIQFFIPLDSFSCMSITAIIILFKVR